MLLRHKTCLALTGLLLAAGAHAITFDNAIGVGYPPAPAADWNKLKSTFEATDEAGNNRYWDFYVGTASTTYQLVTSAGYQAAYGVSLPFPSSQYALINTGYFGTELTVDNFYIDPDFNIHYASPFLFTGVEAAAFSDAIGNGSFSSNTVTFEGYSNNQLVATFTADLSDTSFNWYASSFATTPIDRLEILSSGPGKRWLIDKIGLTYLEDATLAAPVPEPEEWALMLTAVGAMVARTAARRRSSSKEAAQ
ncbi:hypothetical protein JCM19000A_27810 [Silvimonas sp. JCM 19000]